MSLATENPSATDLPADREIRVAVVSAPSAHPLARLLTAAEDLVVRGVAPFSLLLLRVSLAAVFVWFGALKVAGVTPVADLVAGTVPFLDRAWFVPALGAVEVVLGLALLAGRWLPLVSLALVAHLAGTFLVLVVQPGIAFQDGNPLLLTTIGEFVVKNVVLVAAALVLASRLQRAR